MREVKADIGKHTEVLAEISPSFKQLREDVHSFRNWLIGAMLSVIISSGGVILTLLYALYQTGAPIP